MKTIQQVILITVSTLTILAGCSSSPVRSPMAVGESDSTSYVPTSIDTLLTETKQTQSETDPGLSMISELLSAGAFSAAEEKLSAIHSEDLLPRQWLLYRLLQGSLLQAQKRFAEALDLYQEKELNKAVANASTTIQWQYGLELAELTAASGDVAKSIRLLYTTQTLQLSPEKLQKVRRPMWEQLIHIDKAGFSQIQKSTAAKTGLAGWIDLANIARNNRTSNTQQLHKLDTWINHWPSHPGLTTALELTEELQKVANGKPKAVALILPLSGELAVSGKAVREGFLAAYFNSKNSQQDLPRLMILDSNREQDIQTTYDKAVVAGAQLIVGPLTKTELRSLIDNPPIQTVTTLALNQISGEPAPAWLKQFALSPAEEIKQVAAQGLFHHPGNALVIYPDNPRGQQQKTILENVWQAEHNQVVAEIAYTEQLQFSEQVQLALNINFSEKRAKQLRRLIGTNSEFSPRRRQDIDTIFLLSDRAEDARSLKPLLDFHYAGDLPIYATSTIFEGDTSKVRDRDINGIIFVHMPWSFNSATTEKQHLQKSSLWKNNSSRLYALGTDAWLIHDRLNLLEKHYYRGNTGTLKFDNRGTMQRNLVVGSFYRGKPLPRTVTVPD